MGKKKPRIDAAEFDALLQEASEKKNSQSGQQSPTGGGSSIVPGDLPGAVEAPAFDYAGNTFDEFNPKGNYNRHQGITPDKPRIKDPFPTTSKAAPKPTRSDEYESALASGIDVLGSMIAKVPSYLVDLGIKANAIANPVNGLMSLDSEDLGKLTEKTTGISEKYNPISPNNAASKHFGKLAMANSEVAAGSYKGDILDALMRGDAAEAGHKAAKGIIQSLPIMLGLAATRGAGASEAASLIGMGLGTSAEEYANLKADNTHNLSKNTLFFNSIITGASEAGTELLGTSLIYNQARKLFLSGAKDQAEDMIRKGIGGYIDKAFKKFFVGAAMLDEGATEAVNTIVKNATDKWSGVDPDRDYTEGAMDSFIIGLGAGATFAAPFHAASAVKKFSNKQTARKLAREQEEINNWMDNEDVSDDVKAKMADASVANNERLNDIIEKDQKETGMHLTPEENERTNKINADIDAKEALIADPNVPTPIKEQAQASVEQLEKDIETILNSAEKRTAEAAKQSESVKPEDAPVPVVDPSTGTVQATKEDLLDELDKELESLKKQGGPDSEEKITAEAKIAEEKVSNGGDEVEYEQEIKALDDRAQKLKEQEKETESAATTAQAEATKSEETKPSPELQAEFDRIRDAKTEKSETNTVKMQGGFYVPESVAKKAFEAYDKKYAGSQSYEQLINRGGFFPDELDANYPDWRKEMADIAIENSKKKKPAAEKSDSIINGLNEDDIRSRIANKEPLSDNQEENRARLAPSLPTEYEKGSVKEKLRLLFIAHPWQDHAKRRAVSKITGIPESEINFDSGTDLNQIDDFAKRSISKTDTPVSKTDTPFLHETDKDSVYTEGIENKKGFTDIEGNRVSFLVAIASNTLKNGITKGNRTATVRKVDKNGNALPSEWGDIVANGDTFEKLLKKDQLDRKNQIDNEQVPSDTKTETGVPGKPAAPGEAQSNTEKVNEAPKVNSKELTNGQEITFNGTDDKPITGNVIKVPGFEDVDFAVVNVGFAKEIHELSTGMSVVSSSSFTDGEIVSQVLSALAKKNLTSGEQLMKAIRAKEHKLPVKNPSPARERYEARLQKEYDDAPFMYSEEERAEITKLMERAEELGLTEVVRIYKGHRDSKLHGPSKNAQKLPVSKLAEQLEYAHKQRRKRDLIEKGEVLPDDLKDFRRAEEGVDRYEPTREGMNEHFNEMRKKDVTKNIPAWLLDLFFPVWKAVNEKNKEYGYVRFRIRPMTELIRLSIDIAAGRDTAAKQQELTDIIYDTAETVSVTLPPRKANPDVTDKPKPAKKVTPHRKRMNNVLGQEPRTRREAILAHFVGGGTLSSSDFKRYSGFDVTDNDGRAYLGFVKSDGYGIDEILEEYGEPISDGGDIGSANDIIDTLLEFKGNKAAMVAELEKLYDINQAPLKQGEMTDEEKYYYNQLTDEERAQADRIRNGELTEDEIKALFNTPNDLSQYDEQIDDAVLTEARINELAAVLDQFTDKDGKVDWDAIYDQIGDTGVSELSNVKPITNEKSNQRPEAGTESKAGSKNDGSQKSAEKPKKPTIKETIKQIESEELDNLWDDFKGTFNQLNSGVNPDTIIKGAKLVAGYTKLGVYKFADIINDAKARLGDAIADYLDGIKQAYASYYSTAPDDIIDKLTDIREVRAFKLPASETREEVVEPVTAPLPSSNDALIQSAGIDPLVLEFERNNNVRLFVDFVKSEITGTENRLNIVAMRKRAQLLGLDVPDTTLQEYAEQAIVEAARAIALDPYFESDALRLAAIETLYQQQPTITQRSSERIDKQQYSTPTPMSFIAGLFGKAIQPQKVFEPSAGNGMLTIAIEPGKIWANEIDPVRLDVLATQGFRMVGSQDATKSFGGLKNQDFVISNPPFGGAPMRLYDGYRISGLDEQMIINALEEMKDGGRAAFIMGGHNRYNDKGRLESEKIFFNYLYNHYNVADVINMSGALYQRQGTTFPTRMILINGRKTTPEGIAPFENKEDNRVVESFTDLYERVQSKIKNNENRNLFQQPVDAVGNNGPFADVPSTTGSENSNPATTNTVPGTEVSTTDEGSVRQQGERNPSDRGQSSNNNPGNNRVRTGAGANTVGQLPTLFDTSEPAAGTAGNIKTGSNEALQGNRPVPPVRESASDLVEKEKVPYIAASKSNPVGSVIPSNMASEAARVLKSIEERHGDIDVFVAGSLGYKGFANETALDALYKAFSAEQIDALAMGIDQIQTGNALIVGDMTGVGKGRIAAGMVRYAIHNGQRPIFLTEKANLFSDLYRDMVDIGSEAYVPFIINDYSKKNDPTVTDAEGNTVYKSLPAKSKDSIYKTSDIPDGYDYVMATYSQFTSAKPTAKKSYFKNITPGSIVIMDESHNVSGTSNSGAYFQEVLQGVKGVMYLSATFAKRPDNMPVYAMKTSMRDANMSTEELVMAIDTGGVALQEIVSSQLVEAGQMIRRERDFTGVENKFDELEELQDKHRDTADEVTSIIRDIIQFQRNHINPIIEGLDQEAQEEGSGSEYGVRTGTGDAGISNTPYTSKVFNVIDQMLFAIKAESVADEAIKELKANRKPVIAFKSTMESFLINAGYKVGDSLTDTSFALSLLRGLNGTMTYTETLDTGDTVQGFISPDDLPPDAKEAYDAIADKIYSASSEISISPIDIIIKKITDAGYKVGEVTGRSMSLQFQDDGTAKVIARQETDIKKNVRKFNNNDGVDVILLNSSGATGLSMHASEKFKDQRQRVMITHQLELDINKEVQKRGRIDRSGQVIRGMYRYIVSKIPAESRLLMMFKAKLKSLDANSTSSQKSKQSLELTDFLNKYGDRVVGEYLKENRQMNDDLLDPFKLDEMSPDKLQDFRGIEDGAQKATGRVAILPATKQEEFYSEITRRYASLMQYLEDNNMNDLEVKSLPLEAETISKTVYKVGKGGTSPFGQNSMIEKVMANVLKKPLTKDQLEKQISENLDGKTPAEQQKDNMRAVKAYFDRQKAGFPELIKDKYDSRREKAAKKFKKKPDDLRAELEALDIAQEQEMIDKENDIIQKEANMLTIYASFRTGEEYQVPNQISSNATTYSRGVFIGFEQSFENVFVPSSVSMRFATLDGRRIVNVPLSQNDFVTAALAGKQQYRAPIGDMKPLREAWDSTRSDKNREMRYIITGNILQAYDGRGQLAAYTTSDGKLKKGILMPQGFEFDDNGIGVPIGRALKAFKELKKGGTIRSSDGLLAIQKDWNGDWELSVPSSKKLGGKYFLDIDLRELMYRQNFFTGGGTMNGNFNNSELESVLNVLQVKFNVSVTLKDFDPNTPPSGGGAPTNQVNESTAEYIADQSNIKPILDGLDGIKIRPGKLFSSIIPVPPAVWNAGIDVVKTILKATNSTQKAIRVGVKYVYRLTKDKAQARAFQFALEEKLNKKDKSIKKLNELVATAEENRQQLSNEVRSLKYVVNASPAVMKSHLVNVLAKARDKKLMKKGIAGADNAANAISKVAQVVDTETGNAAVEAVLAFLENVGHNNAMKNAMETRGELSKLIRKNRMSLTTAAMRLSLMNPKKLTSEELQQYLEIAPVLASQLAALEPGMIDDVEINAFLDKVTARQEADVKKKLIEFYKKLNLTEDMTVAEMRALIEESKPAEEEAEQTMKPKEFDERQTKKRQILNAVIELNREELREKNDVPDEMKDVVESLLDIDTDQLTNGDMIRLNQIIAHVVANDRYTGAGYFHKINEGIKDMKKLEHQLGIMPNKGFRPITFESRFKNFVKGSRLAALSMTDKLMHVNTFAKVGKALDAMLNFGINHGHSLQKNDMKAITEKLDELIRKHAKSAESMYRIGVIAELNAYLVNDKRTPEEQFADNKDLLRQSVEALENSSNDYEKKMHEILSDIWNIVEPIQSRDELMNGILTEGEQIVYDYIVGIGQANFNKLFENNEAYGFEPMGEKKNYVHRKYHKIRSAGEKVNLIDDEGDITQSANGVLGQSGTKQAITVKKKLPKDRVIDYNIHKSFRLGLNESLNDIYTLGERIKTNYILNSKKFEELISAGNTYGKENLNIIKDSVRQMVNIQRGVTKIDMDMASGAVKFNNFIRKVSYATAVGTWTAGAPQWASSMTFTATNVKNTSALFQSMLLFAQNSGKATELIKQASGGTINRDLQGDNQLEEELSNLTQGIAKRNIGEVLDKMEKINFKSLRFGDRYASLHTWLAGYIDDLIETGVIAKASDFDLEMLEKHVAEPVKSAANNGETMVTLSNNESDSSRRANMLVPKTSGDEWKVDILYYLKKFGVAMNNKLWLGVRNVSEWDGGQADGVRLIAGAAGSIVIYNAIRDFILNQAFDKVSEAIMEGMGFGGGDDEEKKRRKMSDEQWAKYKADRMVSKFWYNSLANLIFSGQIAPVEQAGKALGNMAYELLADDMVKEAKKNKEYAPRSPFYASMEYSQALGMYGQVAEIGAKTASIAKDIAKEEDASDLARSRRALFSVGIPVFNQFFLRSADVDRINRRIEKRIEEIHEKNKDLLLHDVKNKRYRAE